MSALENMKALLEGAGSGLEHVVKVTAYLANIARDYDVFNEIYAEVGSCFDLIRRELLIGDVCASFLEA